MKKKKIYVCPAMETVEVSPRQFLAISNLDIIYDQLAEQNADGTFGNSPFMDMSDMLEDMILFGDD
jgi:hypothetical protein